MSNIRIRVLPALLIGIVLLAPPVVSAQSASAQITGTIAYRERVALPSEAVIDIQLQDVSIADIAAPVIAETMLNAEGRQVPVQFSLTYDPAKIDPSHRYSVRATIRSGDGMLMFTTAQSYPVLTAGAPSKVNLLLRTVGHGPKPGAVVKPKTQEHTPQPAAETADKQPPDETSPKAVATETAPPPAPQAEASQAEKTPPSEGKPAPQPGQAAPSVVSQPSDTASATKADEKSTASTPVPAPSEAKPSEAAPAGSEITAAAPQQTPSEATAPQAAPPERAIANPESGVATSASPQPQPKAADTQPVPSDQPAVASEPLPAGQQTQQTETKPADTQPATQEPKPAETQEALPDSPSTVAKLASPEVTPEPTAVPEPEPEPESRPERPKADTPLADTQWKLVQLGGVQIVIDPFSHPMTLAFSPEGRRIAGSAGCHSYVGTFTDEQGKLSLKPGDMVSMGCPQNVITREQKFVAAMRDADAYRIAGNYLVLTSKGKVVARLKNQLVP